ncbi:hypothetical protein PPTG_21692 [Phytophthora nicotianae INRA-310]|uniref:Uncharacterized protein n=3 Tax=Phytophthora nicotianae TaxID=4792 RepID=W2QZX8_PHYN3|nr:hypothetical protein PPTG_21692 [Phytophthora nicotianae INRA-310]ETN17775.1 hypothetical protein PPTG_21692 [Phytophthora nicotianae INRA-310]
MNAAQSFGELAKPGRICAYMANAGVVPSQFDPARTGGALSRLPGHGQPSQSPSSALQVIPTSLAP